ncbi:MAG: DUF4160 domain-containing protein [Oscillospiraceae bacterium]|nr:DUF4160 domain-containing protein [Oscillospiraceae bacterium]
MPQIFNIFGYIVYFWSNENNPLEPVHVHVSKGIPSAHATKIWITQTGHCLLCNNNSKIPNKILKYIMEIIEARHAEIINKWYDNFGEIKYYC